MLDFELTNEVKMRISKAFFGKYVKNIYKHMKKLIDKKLFERDGQIDLVLISDERMQDLNKEFRSKDSPTDVISFAYLDVTDYEFDMGEIIVGDIFISVDTAKRQAKENGHSVREELAILFVHGLLHCFGFDHQTDGEEKKMDKWAKKILKT